MENQSSYDAGCANDAQAEAMMRLAKAIEEQNRLRKKELASQRRQELAHRMRLCGLRLRGFEWINRTPDDQMAYGKEAQQGDSDSKPQWSVFALTQDELGDLFKCDGRTVLKRHKSILRSIGKGRGYQIRTDCLDDLTFKRLEKIINNRGQKRAIARKNEQ